jgi:magnesium transporter
MGADYLAHAVLDAVVDNLFPVFEQIDADIQEQETLTLSGSDNMDEVHRLRRELALVRRKLRPLRELLSQLATIESDLLTEDVRPFLRDLRDHGLQVLDDLELVGDHLRVLIDLQLNQLNQQTNSIVKTLTIVASIFIPLTFLAGLYGMNFEHLPGANSPFGFAVICVIMALVAGGLLLYFKKKKWI